jgi:uncharacterized protein YigA (DUF484 family)
MTTRQPLSPDALAGTTRDISRHIAGLADELLYMHHNRAGNAASLVSRQIDKIRDQIALLSAVVNDLAQAEQTSADQASAEHQT